MKTNKSPTKIFSSLFVLLLSATIAASQETPSAVSATEAESQVRYRVIDLGTGAVANDINEFARMAGGLDFPSEGIHGSFWPNIHSVAIDLGTLRGDAESYAFGINPRNEIVGTSLPNPVGGNINPSDFSAGHPVFWPSPQSAPVRLRGLPVGFGTASDINAAGQIVGQFTPRGQSRLFPVFWPNGDARARFLPVKNRFPAARAISINHQGNILGDGCSADFSECHAAFWASATSAPVILPSPDEPFVNTDIGGSTGSLTAHALNSRGEMVGFAYNADFTRTVTVYWASPTSRPVILRTSRQFPNGTAEGINGKGQIVGTAYNSDFSDFHAFFWPSPHSPGIDLNTVIRPGSGLELIIARSINGRGEIVGAAFANGQPLPHAVVLIPAYD